MLLVWLGPAAHSSLLVLSHVCRMSAVDFAGDTRTSAAWDPGDQGTSTLRTPLLLDSLLLQIMVSALPAEKCTAPALLLQPGSATMTLTVRSQPQGFGHTMCALGTRSQQMRTHVCSPICRGCAGHEQGGARGGSGLLGAHALPHRGHVCSDRLPQRRQAGSPGERRMACRLSLPLAHAFSRGLSSLGLCGLGQATPCICLCQRSCSSLRA